MWIFAKKKKERKKDAFLIRFTVWLNNPFSPVLIPGKSTEAEDSCLSTLKPFIVLVSLLL